MDPLNPVRPKIALLTVLGALIVSLIVIVALRQEKTILPWTGIPQELLPAGWATHEERHWTIGIPENVRIEEDDHTIRFSSHSLPLLSVTERKGDFMQMLAAEEAEPGAQKSSFLVAGYPAIRYERLNNATRYYIAYSTPIIIDLPNGENPTASLMLATFQFLD